MKIVVVVWMLLAVILFSCEKQNTAGNTNDYETIKEGFKNPPMQARPKVYWWWLNGHVDTTQLKTELTAIKNNGLGGVDIFEIGIPDNEQGTIPSGPAFMGDEFMLTLKAVLSEAAKLDLEVGLNLASSWNAGGSWTLPQHAAKTLYVSKVSVALGTSEVKIPFPTIQPTDPRGRKRVIQYGKDGKPVYREEVAVLAVPVSDSKNDTSRIINVSKFFDAEKDVLRWAPPAGKWEIQRYVCANSGEQLFMSSGNSIGPIIDHFDSSATRAHVKYFVTRLKSIFPDDRKLPIKYLYLASYEAKDFTWTSTLPAMFKQTAGYDIYKYLPVLFDNSVMDEETSTRFKYDFRKAMSELMINNHYRKAKEVTNQYGLQIASESGGPGVYPIPVETLKALGSLDIPRGEFWHKTTRFEKDSVDIIWLVKEIAAASHIYKRSFVEEEAFTSFSNDWQEGPSDLKPLADRAFCEGMNRVVIHGMTHNPDPNSYPGIGYFAGTHFNPKSVWWPKGKPFVDYLSRISCVLQQTRFVSDVLYYYGDDVPNLVPPKNTRFKAGNGFDYEIINTEVLLRDLIVEDGKLVLPGVGTYHTLSLANDAAINPEVLSKLKTLAEKGAIITGTKPTTSYGLNRSSDNAISTASEFWTAPVANAFNQRGKVYSNATASQVLNYLKLVPDFITKLGKKVDFIHYDKGDLDFYLIRNTTDQPITTTGLFRQTGKVVEIWNPESGDISSLSVYKQINQQVEIPLSIPANGLQIFVFKPGAQHAAVESLPDDKSSQPFEYAGGNLYNFSVGTTITQPWKVSFTKGWGAPDSVSFPALQSWTTSETPGIKYYSGTATYTNEFEFAGAPDNARVIISLGDVSKVAEVFINGQSAGIAWTKPYHLDITRQVKKGKNKIMIEVNNNWANRLIGDAILKENYTSSNIKFSNRSKKVLWADTPLIESGLLGPVTILVSNPLSTNF